MLVDCAVLCGLLRFHKLMEVSLHETIPRPGLFCKFSRFDGVRGRCFVEFVIVPVLGVFWVYACFGLLCSYDQVGLLCSCTLMFVLCKLFGLC